MKNKTPTHQLLLAPVFVASLALAHTTQAHAEPYTIAYDNGGVGYDDRYCISGPNQCGNFDGKRFTIYNPFTLPSETNVIGFRNWNGGSSPETYIKTSWSIWSGEPGRSGTALYSGIDVATITSDLGFNMATLVGLDITLNSGTYWLGISHETTSPWTYIVPRTWVAGALQSDGQYYNIVGQMAFQVLAVPELSTNTLTLTGLGLAALVARLRRARTV